MPPRRNRVTDVQRLLNDAQLTETPVADTEAATGGGGSNAKGPSIKSLMVFDSTDAGISSFSPILARAYYPNARLVGVESMAGLTAALSKYSRIDTLIINTHSAPGYLMIGNSGPTARQVHEALAKTGVTVQSKIVFEGCQIMQDPISTCLMVEKICGPNTQVTGFTYFSITAEISIDCTGIHDPADIEDYYKQLKMDYLLPNLPPAEDSVDRVVKHGRRWFRDEYDKTLPENGNFLHIESLQSLKDYQIKSAQDALQAKADFSGPVVPGAKVTVTNVAAVAHADAQQTEATAPVAP